MPDATTNRFNAQMTVGEAMALHPRAAEVFMSFHLGGCSHCGISAEETIAQVCAGYGIPEDMLIEALNSIGDEVPPVPAPPPQP